MKTIVDLETDLVKPYIDAKDLAEAQTRAILGAHNLVPFPYFASSYTTNGITFTVNSDGTITANGTATALAIFDAINGALDTKCPASVLTKHANCTFILDRESASML